MQLRESFTPALLNFPFSLQILPIDSGHRRLLISFSSPLSLTKDLRVLHPNTTKVMENSYVFPAVINSFISDWSPRAWRVDAQLLRNSVWGGPNMILFRCNSLAHSLLILPESWIPTCCNIRTVPPCDRSFLIFIQLCGGDSVKLAPLAQGSTLVLRDLQTDPLIGQVICNLYVCTCILQHDTVVIIICVD